MFVYYIRQIAGLTRKTPRTEYKRKHQGNKTVNESLMLATRTEKQRSRAVCAWILKCFFRTDVLV